MFFSRRPRTTGWLSASKRSICVMSLLSIFPPLLHHNKLLRSHVVYYSLLFSF